MFDFLDSANNFLNVILIGMFCYAGYFVVRFLAAELIGEKNREPFKKQLLEKEFHIKDSVFNEFSTKGLAIDKKEEKIAILKVVDSKTEEIEIFSYRDILGVEIVTDGGIVSRTSRTSQASRAIIGGLLFGGLGFLAGAFCANKKIEEKVEKIDLRIYLNSEKNSVFELDLLMMKSKKGEYYYKNAIKNANTWDAYLKSMIKRADLKDEEFEHNNFDILTASLKQLEKKYNSLESIEEKEEFLLKISENKNILEREMLLANIPLKELLELSKEDIAAKYILFKKNKK